MRCLITIEPVVFIFFFSYALLQPLLQQYIYDELSLKYNFTKRKQEELCENGTEVGHNITSLESKVQTEASYWFLALVICTCIPSIFTSLFLGTLSDVVGRRPVLFIAIFGSFLRSLVIAITVTFEFSLYFVFLGSFIEGLTGSLATILALCLAYIVDITDKESRSFRIGVIDIIVLVAVTASFFISGVWLKVSGYKPPFWAGVGSLFICCIYIAFFLPESLLNTRANTTRVSCMVQVKRIKAFFLAKRGRHVNTCFILLLISFLFSVFDYFGSVTILYTKHYPLCWGSELISFYLAAGSAFPGLGIIFGFKVLGRIFSDCTLVIIGCSLFLVNKIMIGFATTTLMMFLSCIPSVFAVLAPPTMRSLASKMVEPHEEGTLCSILGIVEALAQLLGPLMTNFLYPVGLTKLHVNGFVYFIQAAILLIPIVLFIIIHHLTRKNDHILNPTFNEDSNSSLIQT